MTCRSQFNPTGAAMNAAGIADALRCCQLRDEDGDNRWQDIAAKANGWVGVVARIAEAGALMETVRSEHADEWGNGLPFLCEVWDQIAQALWDHFESQNFERLLRRAIARADVLDPTTDR